MASTTQLHMGPMQVLNAWRGHVSRTLHYMHVRASLLATLSNNYQASVYFDTSLALHAL